MNNEQQTYLEGDDKVDFVSNLSDEFSSEVTREPDLWKFWNRIGSGYLGYQVSAVVNVFQFSFWLLDQ